MAYDEQSFLNGLAAGLTVTGGSKIGADVLPDGWSQVMYRVRVAAGESIGLKYYGRLTPTPYAYADWGDGLSGQGEVGVFKLLWHTYQEAGEYVIVATLNNGVTEVAGIFTENYDNKRSLIYEVSITGTGIRTISGEAFYYQQKLTSVTLPESLTEIGGGEAFMGCEQLQSINSPESLRTLGFRAFDTCVSLTNFEMQHLTQIGDSAFQGCTNITNITIPNANIECLAFRNTGITALEIPGYIKHVCWSMFAWCCNLTNVVIRSGVEQIGGDEVKPYGWHNGVFIHGYQYDMGVFASCEKLTSISIPLSVKHIDFFTFSFSEALRDIYYEGSQSQWNSITTNPDGSRSPRLDIYNATIHYNSAGPNA